MPETAVQTVLRRKLAPPRSQWTPEQGDLQRLLAKTMPRDANELLGLQVALAAVEPGRKDKAQVIKWLEPHDLLFLMRSGKAPHGICAISSGLLAGLIEMQMSGHIATADPPERVPTRTDAIVASDIVDRWIASAREEAEQKDMLERLPFADYYRAAVILDSRSADLAIDPGEFRTLRLTLELAGGARSGYLSFALPGPAARRSAPATDTAEALRAAIVQTRASISVILARLPKTLEEVAKLSVNSVLDVPIEALRLVSLETGNGKPIAKGRLGQSGGKKAVRVLTHRVPGSEMEAPEALSVGFMGTALPSAGTLGEMDGKLGTPTSKDDPLAAALMTLPSEAASEQTANAGAEGIPELPDLPDLPD